jgi:hypothetical protein
MGNPTSQLSLWQSPVVSQIFDLIQSRAPVTLPTVPPSVKKPWLGIWKEGRKMEKL